MNVQVGYDAGAPLIERAVSPL